MDSFDYLRRDGYSIESADELERLEWIKAMRKRKNDMIQQVEQVFAEHAEELNDLSINDNKAKSQFIKRLNFKLLTKVDLKVDPFDMACMVYKKH
jgi:hypothetical protein